MVKKIKRNKTKSARTATSNSYSVTYSSVMRILGIAVAVIALLVIGKTTYQNMANNTRASVADECKNEIWRLTNAKRQVANLEKTGEEIDEETQAGYDEAYKNYLTCKTNVKQVKNERRYGEPGTQTPIACGKWGCHSDETCLKTENAKANDNAGYECVPSRCLTNNVVNTSLSYCDPNQNLINCNEFLNGGGFQSFSCTSKNMTCVDNGLGKAECKATTNTTNDCRKGANPNANCDASSFCNLQTGRCVRSSNVDGNIIDSKKADCTSTYVREGCGPNGDGVQTCKRSWNDASDLCVNTSCGVCQF